MSGAEFTYDDIVRVKNDAPSVMRPRERAWVIGILPEGHRLRKGSGHGPGTVYSVEFEGGEAIDIHENLLQPDAE